PCLGVLLGGATQRVGVHVAQGDDVLFGNLGEVVRAATADADDGEVEFVVGVASAEEAWGGQGDGSGGGGAEEVAAVGVGHGGSRGRVEGGCDQCNRAAEEGQMESGLSRAGRSGKRFGRRRSKRSGNGRPSMAGLKKQAGSTRLKTEETCDCLVSSARFTVLVCVGRPFTAGRSRSACFTPSPNSCQTPCRTPDTFLIPRPPFPGMLSSIDPPICRDMSRPAETPLWLAHPD